MAVLMVGETERERIAQMIAYAKAHPITFETVRTMMVPNQGTTTVRLEDRNPEHARPESQHIDFPGGFRAAYSVEEQPAGMCAHLSVSVFGRSKRGAMPHPAAVAMIAEEFGVPFPADKMWQEEFEPGEWAVNLLHLYAPKQEGYA